jgi:carboxypeptidase family protein/Kelch motif protein
MFRTPHEKRAVAGWTGAVAVLSAVALAAMGVPAPAAAAGPVIRSAADPASSASLSYQPVCGTAKPGTFACLALRRTDIPPVRAPRVAGGLPAGFGPADLQGAYSLPSGGGAGQTIAIVDAFDDPTSEADMAVYRQQYGLPACTAAGGCFTKVDQRGGTDYPPANGGWAGEISLDLDMVSAIAPAAHILLVEADDASDDALSASVDEAVTLGAKFVSNSYGTDYVSGPGEDPSETTTMDAHYHHPGVAVIASAGDSGYGVSYPAASQYVTSVGGTSLIRDPGSGRGWSERAWSGTGSGCSLYEPKPAFQHDSGCARRSVADVSAVADPATGVAVYQTGVGWGVFGGTSVSSPIIAGVYADAGTPAAGTDPNSYPYAAGTGLHDVTGGNDGACTVGYLCNAVPGYDGPTGLGSPDGLAAFRTGPHGTVAGTVTDRAGGKPIVGATVGDGTDVAHTDAQGRYTLALPAGSRSLTVTAFGYATGNANLTVTADTTVTKNLTLTRVPSETVSGTVTDGSGQGWPLYAKITVAGDPNAVWTDPRTGRYQLTLPRDTDYTLNVAPASPGYDQVSKTVHVATAPLSVNAAAIADPWVATAAGYHLKLTGPTATFDSTTSAPAGWSVVDAPNTSGGWRFDDPGRRSNSTGGDGAFAIADSNYIGFGSHFDTSLISPVFDFAGDTQPEVGFDTMWVINPVYEFPSVEASDDGGTTWTTVWTPDLSGGDYVLDDAHFDVPLTAYAGKPAVQVRFHYVAHGGFYWGVDDVFVGQRDFPAVAGGLVVGTVRDANTGQGVADATVTGDQNAPVRAQTVATPEDPNLSDGYYSLFVPGPGKHTLTAAKFDYVTTPRKPTVRVHRAVEANFRLAAGQLRVRPGSIKAAVDVGRHASRTLTITNTGTAPATLQIGEQAGTASPSTAQGALLQRIPGAYPMGHITGQQKAGTPRSGPSAAPADDAWQSAPTLPEAALDDVADAYNGKIYSGFGDAGLLSFGYVSNNLYAMDPAAGTWTQLASATDGREAPGHGIIGGKLYIAGGWTSDGTPQPTMEIYDIAGNTWTAGPAVPVPTAGAGSAVLDGKLYLVGGCTAATCAPTDSVSVYDPATSDWSQIARYPEAVAWISCAAIGGKLYCAGGANESANFQHAYVYTPATGAWSTLPDMPISLWGSSYAAANGMLIISSGVTGADNILTNQAVAYNPRSATWTALPNANTATYRGAGALGYYKLGGSPDGFSPTGDAEYLPGYAVDPNADVPWLAESATRLTLRPHQRVTVTIALDASAPKVTQPGTYNAQLMFGSDTPYPLPSVPVTLTVNRPPYKAPA